MKLLLIAEKKLLSNQVIAAIPDSESHEIDVLCLSGMGFHRFHYPQSLPISEVPAMHPVSWRQANASDLPGKESWAIVQTHGQELVKTSETIREQIARLSSEIKNYEEVVVCTHPCHRGHFAAAMLIAEFTSSPEEVLDSAYQMSIDTQEPHKLKKAWFERHPYDGHQDPWVRHGEAKYLFDWLWAINSAPVFGKALRMAGASDKTILSKYELLTFMLLAKGILVVGQKGGLSSRSRLLHDMAHYQGTGKYDPNRSSFGLGSPASRYSIIENLIQRGLISDDLQLTSVGKEFLGLVHSRSYDPDLPFRLDEWSKGYSNECSRERYFNKIRGYIETYFTRQKNFNSTHRYL